jgi:hypothetical protein
MRGLVTISVIGLSGEVDDFLQGPDYDPKMRRTLCDWYPKARKGGAQCMHGVKRHGH